MKRWPRGSIMPAGAHVVVMTTGGGRLVGMLIEPRFLVDDVVIRLDGSEEVLELPRSVVRGVHRAASTF